MISAGDQVNKTGKPKEEEYASYLSADVLSGLATATTIGNHDSLNEDYMYHFNNPNASDYGTTAAGGDYYYTYGDGLFIVLNTNNYNVAEHEQLIKEATEAIQIQHGELLRSIRIFMEAVLITPIQMV